MKVPEQRVLADRKLAKCGGPADELLATFWEETLDAGRYTLGGDAELDLGTVLQEDRSSRCSCLDEEVPRRNLSAGGASASA